MTRKIDIVSYGKILIYLAGLCYLGINHAVAHTATSIKLPYLEKEHQVKEKNKTLLIEFIEEIWNKGNLDKTDKYVASPYVIHHDPGDPWNGQSLDLATFKKRVNSSHQAFPDLHFTIQDIVAEGDKVAISWRFEGTHKGDVPGLPATGKRVNISGLTIYDFSNGKIAGHWQVVDRLGFMQQVGPKPGVK